MSEQYSLLDEQIKLFSKLMHRQCQILDNGGDGYIGMGMADEDTYNRYRAEVKLFDDKDYREAHRDFLTDFVRWRQDPVSSDRESAAFVRAYNEFQMIMNPDHVPTVGSELGIDTHLCISGSVKVTNRDTGDNLLYEDMSSYDEDVFCQAVCDGDGAEEGFFCTWENNGYNATTYDYRVCSSIIATEVARDDKGVDRIKDVRSLTIEDLPADAQEAIAHKILENPGGIIELNLSSLIDEHELANFMGDKRFEVSNERVECDCPEMIEGKLWVSGTLTYDHEIEPNVCEPESLHFDYCADDGRLDISTPRARYEGDAPSYIYRHLDQIEPIIMSECESAISKNAEHERESEEQEKEKKKHKNRGR